MKILALEHDLSSATSERFQQFARAEARQVWELNQAGVIREVYFRADKSDAVLVLECDSIVEAEEKLSTLPFVKEALIGFELIPLKAYPGFARLFEGN